MSNYYDLEGIQKQLSRELAEARALLAAWEAVTFPTKKDGKPFKVMSKNISGATYATGSFAMQACENRVTVSTWSNAVGYISDDFNAYEVVKYMTDKAKQAKIQNYQPKVSYLEQIYTYDLDDIKEAVAAKVEGFKARVARLENEIRVSEAAYIAFRDAYTAALAQLKKDSGARSDLYVAVRDTITARHR